MSKNYKNVPKKCAAVTTRYGRCKNDIYKNYSYCKRHAHANEYIDDDSTFESNASEVIKGLWIGSLDSTQDAYFLKNYKIKSIVNISGIEPTPKYRQLYDKLGITYYTTTTQRRVKDSKTGQTRQVDEFLVDDKFNKRNRPTKFYDYMDRGVAFIKAARKKGPVLVNCHAGINRSCSLIVAYLTTKTRHPYAYSKAVKMITDANKKRDIETLSNDEFKTALKYYPRYVMMKYPNKRWTMDAKNVPSERAFKIYMSKYSQNRRKSKPKDKTSKTHNNRSKSAANKTRATNRTSRTSGTSTTRRSKTREQLLQDLERNKRTRSRYKKIT